MEKICKWQIIGIVGAVIVLVGMFLPWATVSEPDGSNAMSVYGKMSPLLWIFFILVIIGAAIPKPAGGILAFIMGLLGLLDAVWNHIGILNIAASMGEDVKITIEYGGYLVMVGFALAMVGGILQYIFLKKRLKEAQATPAPEEPAPPS